MKKGWDERARQQRISDQRSNLLEGLKRAASAGVEMTTAARNLQAEADLTLEGLKNARAVMARHLMRERLNVSDDGERPDTMSHKEAFALMWYECSSGSSFSSRSQNMFDPNDYCGTRLVIWNSRDGVTPFCSTCPSCGRPSFYHVRWDLDIYAPNHQLRFGQMYWRDATMADFELLRADPNHHYHNLSDDRLALVKEDFERRIAHGTPWLGIHTREHA